MAHQHDASTYYVPEQSKLPLITAFAMFLTVYGLGSWFNNVSAGPFLFASGFLLMAGVMFAWFSAVIKENLAGLNNAQLKRSYVWGMGWFIFSEVMFFAAFFGALFYVRVISLPELGTANNSELLWGGFKPDWPLMTTPDMAVKGEAAKHLGPEGNMSNPGILGWLSWLPFWNTVILLTSSFTVHFAHTALKKHNKKQFNIWLGVTVFLGICFLILQIEEYVHAYQELGLTLHSGIYGATFFMLTGFHGAHVTIGTFMLLVMLLRSVLKGHFKHDDCFGFEAASWYWHFVDVVWLGLFIFVYILS
ncbi:cytochrome c oxidase subunit 3 [Saccharophagus sp. K07]|jgi:cytochrome c oxidase subunit 3|uniref:cytochrome c oxidase subunit 3 n=1 Tax=Saccharophagus sp. K07 TaxID=2283636 RepID=UPI001651F4EA|nr:cytochrome c oxidase subunit 3 [Saccharophagus sp. K07]MBC6906178.1 cytochrome c oxidase subunit 3 [Saccharophagus sp. K07]